MEQKEAAAAALSDSKRARLPNRAVFDYALRPQSEIERAESSSSSSSSLKSKAGGASARATEITRKLDARLKERNVGQAMTVNITRSI